MMHDDAMVMLAGARRHGEKYKHVHVPYLSALAVTALAGTALD
jgi:hypothetical protein